MFVVRFWAYSVSQSKLYNGTFVARFWVIAHISRFRSRGVPMVALAHILRSRSRDVRTVALVHILSLRSVHGSPYVHPGIGVLRYLQGPLYVHPGIGFLRYAQGPPYVHSTFRLYSDTLCAVRESCEQPSNRTKLYTCTGK